MYIKNIIRYNIIYYNLFKIKFIIHKNLSYFITINKYFIKFYFNIIKKHLFIQFYLKFKEFVRLSKTNITN